MKINKLLAFICLGILLSNCEDDKNALNNLFSIDSSALKQVYEINDNINLVIKNEQEKKIDSVKYSINGELIGKVGLNSILTYKFENNKLDIYFKIGSTTDSSSSKLLTASNFDTIFFDSSLSLFPS